MATNALTYIRNVGKSIGYASIDVLKEKNPVITNFMETNGTVISDTYKTIRNLKKSIRSLQNREYLETEFGKFGQTYINNLMSDIKTGKLYNKDRGEEYEDDAAKSFMGDLDMSVFDDFGEGTGSDFGSLDEEISSNDMMDIVGERASNAVSTAVARSAEYMVQANAQTTRALQKENQIIYSRMHNSMNIINENIANLLRFSNENVNTHIENSRNFYENITRLDEERNNYLKDILETVKSIKEPPKKQDKNNENSYSNIVDADGIIDLEKYGKNIIKNLKENTGGVNDILEMMLSGDMLKTLAASPLQFVAEGLVKSVIPKALDKSMESLNKTLSGVVGNLFAGLKDKIYNSDSPVWELLSNIFGINTERKDGYDVGRYEKGKVPFDGITRKAIIEVIPTYLSKILSTLNGQERDTFDYDQGKFVSVKSLKELKDKRIQNSANTAASDLDSVVREKLKDKSFRNPEQEKQFWEDWEKIKLEMYKQQMRGFDTRNRNLNGSTFGLDSNFAVELLRGILDGTSANMGYANRMFRETSEHNRRLDNMSDHAAENAINNDSDKSESSTNTGISAILSQANSAVVDKLLDIHKELSYIRIYGVGGTGSRGNRNRRNASNRPNFNDFNIPTSVTQEAVTEAQADSGNTQGQVDDSWRSLQDAELLEEINRITSGAYRQNTNNEQTTDTEVTSENTTNSNGRRRKKTLSEKIESIKKGALGIIQGPLNLASAVIDKVDARIYELFYGPVGGREDREDDDRTLSEILFDNLENQFEKFSEWMEEKVFDPLKFKSLKENSHDAAAKFLGIFGIDLDETVKGIKEFLLGTDEDGNPTEGGIFGKFVLDFKKTFSSIGNWIKDGFKDLGEETGVSSKLNVQGKIQDAVNKGARAVLERDKKMKEKENQQNQNAESSSTSTEATNRAFGITRIKRRELAVLSPGEMVIPASSNPFVNAENERKEQDYLEELGLNGVHKFAEGITNTSSADKPKTQKEQRIERETLNWIRKNIQGKSDEEVQAFLDEYAAKHPKAYAEKVKYLNTHKDTLKREHYEEGRNPFLQRSIDNLIGAIDSVAQGVKDNLGVDKGDAEKFKENAWSVIGDIKEHGGTLAAGAVMGGGVSLLTGLVGGPLVGAAAGAGVALIQKSKFVREALFGSDEEDGAPGLLPKKVTEAIKKYAPDVAKGGALGGILSFLPIFPGGPLTGLLVGSALGFAKNNEKVQQSFFGDILNMPKEDFIEKVRSVLPKMGAGALAGIVAGPFGLTTNILLGSALGFAADTNTFKEKIFGNIVDFVSKNVIQPIKDTLDPLKKQFEIMGKAIVNLFKDNIIIPIGKTVKEKILNPIGKAFSFLLKPITGLAKFIVGAPFRMIGGIGNMMRGAQVKSGDADYMKTAKERNALRETRGFRMGFIRKDRFKESDQSLEKMDAKQLEIARKAIEAVNDSNKSEKSLKSTAYKNISEAFKDNAIPRDLMVTIKTAFKRNQFDDAVTAVENSNLEADTKQKLLDVVKKEAEKLKESHNLRSGGVKAKEDALKAAKEAGLNLNSRQLKNMARGKGRDAQNLLNQIDSEIKSKSETPGEQIANEINKEEDKRHAEIVDLIEDAIFELKMIHAKGEEREKLIAERNKRKGITEANNSDAQNSNTDNQNNTTDGTQTAEGGEPTEEGDKKLTFRERIRNYLRSRYDDHNAVTGTISLVNDARKMITDPLWKGTKGVAGFGFGTAMPWLGGKAKGLYDAARDSGIGRTVFGNRNIDWHDYAQKLDKDGNVVGLSQHQQDELKRRILERSGDKIKSNLESKADKDDENNATNKLLKRLIAIEAANAAKNGVDTTDIDTDGDHESILSKIKNKYKSSKIYHFFNGHAVAFRQNEDGTIEQDPSDANNDEFENAQQEEQEHKKGLLEGIKSTASKFGDFIKKFFNDDEEEETWLSKLLDKAKLIPAIVAGFGALGWAKQHIFPGIKQFWDEKMLPYFNDAWNGKKDGFGQFIFFLNPKNPNGLLENARKLITETLPNAVKTGFDYLKQIMPTLATYVADGIRWTLSDVLPALLSAVITKLPSILGGLFKGLATGILDGIGGLFHKTNKITSQRQASANMENSKLNAVTNNAVMPSWFDKNVKLTNQSKETTKDSSSNFSIDTQKYFTDTANKNNTNVSLSNGSSNTTISSTVMKQSASMMTSGSLPKAFDYVNEGYRSAALQEYEKVKDNVVNTAYGDMTVSQILNSDLEFGNTPDGTPIHGYELLNYTDTAQELGMNLVLDKEQIKENTKNQGVHHKNIFTELGKAGTKSFVRGAAGISTGVKGASTAIKGGAKIASFATRASGKILSLIPGKGFGSKAIRGAGKLIGKTGSIIDKVGDIVSNIPKAANKLGDKFMKAAKNSKIAQYIAIASEAIIGFFKNNKVTKYITSAISKVNGSAMAKTVKGGLGKFAEKIIKPLSEKLLNTGLGKLTAKFAGKLTAYIASGSVLLIADAVVSFISGYNNADSILGITEEPNMVFKVLAGILEALNSVFCLGLIPLSFIVDTVIGAADSIGWKIFDDLKGKRAEAQAEVDAYNAKHGTDLNVEEYNKKTNSFLYKAKNWLFGNDDDVINATGSGAAIGLAANIANNAKNLSAEYSSINGKGSYIDTDYNPQLKNVNLSSYNGRGSGIAGRGGNFISQLDPKYSKQRFNIAGDSQVQTLGDTGCAPAAAAMAVNGTYGSQRTSMEDASKLALKYKVKDDGVNASYFNDEFARHGLQANYIMNSDNNARSQEITRQLMNNNKVVLMGQDSSNKSKAASPFGPNPHYVVANGLSEDGKFIYINDPESNRPNIRYSADKILRSSRLGISANAAMGSKMIKNAIRKFTGRGTYGEDSIQYKVWNALRAAGYSEIATAAAMGNIQHESGFRPDIIEKGSGVGFGLAQWSYGRRTALENYARSKGISPSDLGVQIEYLLMELDPKSGIWTKASSKYGLGSLKRSDWADGTDLAKATKAFMCCFERPSYDSSVNHIDRRLEAAKEFFEAFTGKEVKTDMSYSTTTGAIGGIGATAAAVGGKIATQAANNTNTSNSPISNIASSITNIISKIAEKYGFSTSSTEETTTNGEITNGDITHNDFVARRNNTISTAEGNVSANADHAEKQKALVNAMYQLEGTLKYAQNNAKYPGSRNPEDGSGDCSSTVQYVYKKILGVDPGSWTGGQRENENTYTVATSTKDESVLQLGDLLLKDGHVEMYAGNNKMIGHGGGKDGKKPGPTVKTLDQSGKYNLVRRWVGFQGSGSDLHPEVPKHNRALQYINPKEFTSVLPFGLDNGEIESPKAPVLTYNKDEKLSSVDMKAVSKSNGRAAEVKTETPKSNDIVTLMKAIIDILVKIVTNTDHLGTIVKLATEYATASETARVEKTQEAKDNAVLAKTNLINAMQNSTSSNEPNAQLMRLIEQTERIARE